MRGTGRLGGHETATARRLHLVVSAFPSFVAVLRGVDRFANLSSSARLLLGKTVHRAAAHHQIHGVEAGHGPVFE